MPLTLRGVFARGGKARVPIIFIDAEDLQRMDQWWSSNGIFSQMVLYQHPDLSAKWPAFFISESKASHHREGACVAISLEVRPEKRGNGVRVVDVT